MTLALGVGANTAIFSVVNALLMRAHSRRTGPMSSVLFHARPSDPVTLAAFGVVLTLVSLGTAWAPARPAMQVDPLAALRCE